MLVIHVRNRSHGGQAFVCCCHTSVVQARKRTADLIRRRSRSRDRFLHHVFSTKNLYESDGVRAIPYTPHWHRSLSLLVTQLCLGWRRICADLNSRLFTVDMVLKIALIALLYYPLSIGLTFYQKWFIKVSIPSF